jgi:hypothetical protein
MDGGALGALVIAGRGACAGGMVVCSEVEKLLMAMQFQDRVSQILCGVNDNIDLMQQALA